MPNYQCKSSRSVKSKASKIINLQTKLPVPTTVNNSFEICGHTFIDAPQRLGAMKKTFKLPILNPAASSMMPLFCKPAEIKSPILTCRTEWKVPTLNKSIQSDSNSQPSFIRSVSASDSESWSDDLENEMTAQLKASITCLDDMFYSSFPVANNLELFQEIKLWQSRFPFLRVVGKKAKIISNNDSPDLEIQPDKEEVIFNDGKFNDNDHNQWANIISDTKDRKNSAVLIKQIRKAVISHLTSHFVAVMKSEFDQNLQPAVNSKVQLKKITSGRNKTLDINDNRLKASEYLDDILNISPISLKVSAPKSNYLSSFSTKKKESAKSKVVSNQSTHLRVEHKLSANIVHTFRQSPRSTMDDMRVNLVFHQSRSSLHARKSSESQSRKHNKKSVKNDDSFNSSRLSTLPPLKTHGLRPTSAIYNSYNKLPNESRPTSSYTLAPSLRIEKTSNMDDS